jgi:hypothetical protein
MISVGWNLDFGCVSRREFSDCLKMTFERLSLTIGLALMRDKLRLISDGLPRKNIFSFCAACIASGKFFMPAEFFLQKNISIYFWCIQLLFVTCMLKNTRADGIGKRLWQRH